MICCYYLNSRGVNIILFPSNKVVSRHGVPFALGLRTCRVRVVRVWHVVYQILIVPDSAGRISTSAMSVIAIINPSRACIGPGISVCTWVIYKPLKKSLEVCV